MGGHGRKIIYQNSFYCVLLHLLLIYLISNSDKIYSDTFNIKKYCKGALRCLNQFTNI